MTGQLAIESVRVSCKIANKLKASSYKNVPGSGVDKGRTKAILWKGSDPSIQVKLETTLPHTKNDRDASLRGYLRTEARHTLEGEN